MKIVVTGALGHIGSRLIRSLPAFFNGVEIVMIDNLLTQRYASLFQLPREGNYRFIEADILKADLVPIVEGATALIHLAAITDATSSFENPEMIEKVNYNATARVAEACSKTGAAMFYPSTTSIYGTQKDTVDEDCEACDLTPQSPYAETKLKEEGLIEQFGRSANLKYVICRFGTIAGISPGMRFHTAVNKFCWQAVMKQPLTVWSTALHQKRPYLDLLDAVEVIRFIINNDLFDRRVYNVLTDNLTVHDIIDHIKCSIPNITVKQVDAKIMNTFSYVVLNKRISERGFAFKGNLGKRVNDTIDLLKKANTQH